MSGSRFGEGLETLVGQNGIGEPPVRGIRLAPNQAALLEALNLNRQVIRGLVDRGGVDVRHYAVGGEAHPAQLLWRQDVDD